MKTFVSTTALMLTVVGLLGGTTFADHQTGLADLAHDLEWQMNRVNRTLNIHFATGPLAREMAADARDMNVLVAQVHDLAENNGCLKTMANKAKTLCELVCEMKAHAAEIRPACGNRSSYGRFGSYDRGYGSGNGCRFGSRFGNAGAGASEIQYLTALLISMENTLENMERELVVLNSVPALPPAPAYNAVPVQPSRFDLQTGRFPVRTIQVNPKVIAPIGHRNGWSVGFQIIK